MSFLYILTEFADFVFCTDFKGKSMEFYCMNLNLVKWLKQLTVLYSYWSLKLSTIKIIQNILLMNTRDRKHEF